LRQLIRNAQKEIAAAKPPKSARMLYRYVKELLLDEGLTQAEEVSAVGEDEDEEEYWEDQDGL